MNGLGRPLAMALTIQKNVNRKRKLNPSYMVTVCYETTVTGNSQHIFASYKYLPNKILKT